MMRNVKVHGTYPMDSGKWITLERRLPLDRVAKLLGIEVTEDEVKEHEKGRMDYFAGAVYLWLNKGFVLIDKPELEGTQGEGNLGLHFVELLGGCPELRGVKKGDKAVYLHDGRYSIIERVKD
jgi:hypothetical protein